MTAQQTSELHRLDGRVAVVTGAAGGLGGAIARHLSSLGATLVLMDRTAKMLVPLANEIRKAGAILPLTIGCEQRSEQGALHYG